MTRLAKALLGQVGDQVGQVRDQVGQGQGQELDNIAINILQIESYCSSSAEPKPVIVINI